MVEAITKFVIVLFVGLTILATLLVFLIIQGAEDNAKNIAKFKSMNCQEQKQWLLLQLDSGNYTSYAYQHNKDYHDVECSK